jgi:GTP pyrophosphokinase
MQNEGIMEKEIQNAIEYAKENGAKKELERQKRVAEELAKKNMPKGIVLAAILKELQTEKLNEKEIEEKFGTEAVQIAKTAKQMGDIIARNYGKLPNETIISILLSLSTDFQPIILKCALAADALYNKDKRIFEEEFAKKARDIWLPIATKLGLNEYAWKIQDFSFRALDLEGFTKIKLLVNKTREEREALVEEVKKEIEELLKGKVKAAVTGRPKSFYAINEKLKKTTFQKMYDIYGIRIICQREKECYEILGYIHSKYEIIPEAFDDYIAKPKNNGYKSIHTAVKRGNLIIEVQIRTWEHHLRTEGQNYWAYKKIKKDQEFEKELGWERQLIEWQKSMGKEWAGKKVLGGKIFVFTPKEDAIPLPIGATIIDFAFAVHTEIGKKMEKATINGKFAPLETKLKNLDKVEILTGEKITPKSSWIRNAITDKAKTKLKTILGIKTTPTKKTTGIRVANLKKIKLAECCHPLPGEDVIAVKTTKRKIVVHKKNCPNIAKLNKNNLMQIDFEKEKGKTELIVKALDRPGLLSEMLAEIKKSGATLSYTNFKIKKTGYAEAIFGMEISNIIKLEQLAAKLERIPSVQSAERK